MTLPTQTRRFSRTAIAIILLLIVSTVFFLSEFDGYSGEEELLHMTWGSGLFLARGDTGEVIVQFHTNPSGINVKSQVLIPEYFSVNLIAVSNQSFTSQLLFLPGDSRSLIAIPRMSNGSLDFQTPISQAYLPYSPGLSSLPLNHRGEYPWDEYSLEFVLALKDPFQVVGVASDLYPNQSLATDWKISQSFGIFSFGHKSDSFVIQQLLSFENLISPQME